MKRPRQDCDSSRGRPGEDALLQSVAEHTQPKLSPQSTLGKAVNYFLNEYEALLGYLEDGRFEIDNNSGGE